MQVFLSHPITRWSIILAISYLYIPLNKRVPHIYPASRWDRLIPLIPSFAYVYILYFPFILFSVAVLIPSRFGTPFFYAYSLATLIASAAWFLYPTGVKRPKPLTQDSRAAAILNVIYTHDGDANGAPSGHVLHSVVCAYYLGLLFPGAAVVIGVIAGSICLSTLLVKQHYLVDVPAGVLVAMVAIAGAAVL